jgi:DNA-binding transcriptional LysR family regulator
LKSLEEQLGTVLCVRNKRGVTLTAPGKALYEELATAFEHIQMGERKLDSIVNLEIGSVKISASDTFCNYYLMPYLTDFHEKHPDIRIEITNRTSAETTALVRECHADLGFVSLSDEVTDELTDEFIVSPFLTVNQVLIAGGKYAHLKGKSLSLLQLTELPLILLENKSKSRKRLDRFFATYGATMKPVMELGSVDSVIEFVKNNHGVGFMPFELCKNTIDGSKLFTLDLSPAPPPSQMGIIERKSNPLSHAAGAFKQLVLEER